MSHFLICSSPIYGHIAPVSAIGRELVRRGHTVSFLTGAKYRSLVEEGGMRFLPLPADVDYDDADLDAWLPGRAKYKGLAAVRYDMIGMFARVIPGQYRGVDAALAAAKDAGSPFDAILAESAFTGLLPLLLLKSASQRPPVLGISALPVTLTSVDAAPFGPALAPGSGALSRLRNRVLNTVLHAGPLKPIRTAMDAGLAEAGAPRSPYNFFDYPMAFDLTMQLSARGLEYPRREMPDSVRFIGPLTAAPTSAAASVGKDALPEWWDDLQGRKVVHVTQGTIDNTDFGRLVVPTLRALADEDVIVVASAGGKPVGEIERAFGGDLPGNARVASFLPYDQLLPRTAVVVTNGGFGGVQQALAHGVPLVVAGATEDKPEVAARVGWSGAGIDLRTGTPKPDAIRAAVRRALGEPGLRAGARRLQSEMAALPDPYDAVVAALNELTERRHSPQRA